MKIASVAEVKARLSAYLKASATGPVVVTRNGKAVAVLLGVSDDEELERLVLAHSRKLRASLTRPITASTKGPVLVTTIFGSRSRQRTRRVRKTAVRKNAGPNAALDPGRIGAFEVPRLSHSQQLSHHLLRVRADDLQVQVAQRLDHRQQHRRDTAAEALDRFLDVAARFRGLAVLGRP